MIRVECYCQKHKDFTNENHSHLLKGDLRIITNSKLRKLISKGPNFRETMSINWNKCKRYIEIGLESSLEPTSCPAHLFAIRRKPKRGPGILQTRDQNLPKKRAYFQE